MYSLANDVKNPIQSGLHEFMVEFRLIASNKFRLSQLNWHYLLASGLHWTPYKRLERERESKRAHSWRTRGNTRAKEQLSVPFSCRGFPGRSAVVNVGRWSEKVHVWLCAALFPALYYLGCSLILIHRYTILIGIFLSRLDISLRLLGIGEITFPITYANVPALRNATREFRLFLFISRLSIVFSTTNHFHFITFVPLVQKHPIHTNPRSCLGASHFHTRTRFNVNWINHFRTFSA